MRPRPRASMRWYLQAEVCHDPSGLRARTISDISLNRVFLMWPCKTYSSTRDKKHTRDWHGRGRGWEKGGEKEDR